MTATKLSVVAGHFYVRRHVHTEGAEENWARYVCVGIWTSVTCASSDLVTACIDGTFTNITRETTTDFTLPESPPPPRSLGSFQFVRGRLLTPLGQLWGLNGS